MYPLVHPAHKTMLLKCYILFMIADLLYFSLTWLSSSLVLCNSASRLSMQTTVCSKFWWRSALSSCSALRKHGFLSQKWLNRWLKARVIFHIVLIANFTKLRQQKYLKVLGKYCESWTNTVQKVHRDLLKTVSITQCVLEKKEERK